MAKRDPAGEVCPHCPTGTPVGYCVRHMLGRDPERQAAPQEPTDQIQHVNRDSWETFQQAPIPLASVVHVGTVGNHMVLTAILKGATEDGVSVQVAAMHGSYDVLLAWGDIVELWPTMALG